MTELSERELALIIEALEEAAFFRDARSRVVQGAVRRSARRGFRPTDESAAAADHQEKRRAFQELADKLKVRGG